MPTVADIILPLPLRSNFSYLLSPEQAAALQPGMRVLAPFGNSKIYTGIVRRVRTENDPERLRYLKPLEEVLDEAPVLQELQLQLFEWGAFYYMCTEGEFIKAALPAGLKPESALRIRAGAGPAEGAGAREQQLLEALPPDKALTFQDAAEIWGILNPMPRLRSMEEKGWVQLFQEVEERYQPKFKSYLRLSEALMEEEAQRAALDSLARAPKQENLLLRVLSDFFQQRPSPKTETLKAVDADSNTARQLIEKGFLEEQDVQVDRLELFGYHRPAAPINFTPAQAQALAAMRAALAEAPQRPVLLHGVTGSGKTHLYIELIRDAQARGKQALYLLPEIALTKQIIERLRGVFGDKVGIYHSRYSDAERVEIWQKVLRNEYDVVLGVRSAVFLPFSNLGIIVVDEEHEPSFKQHEPAPRYHARDLAIYYAQLAACQVVLGTATPSFESYLNALRDKYFMVELPERAVAAHPSQIRLIDLRVARKQQQLKGIFSQELLDAIRDTLARREQVILFQNRRGYSPYIMCEHCGYTPACINCDINLTYHKHSGQLRCHYCGHHDALPDKCPACGHYALRKVGAGTEKIEEQVSLHFPQAVVQRMDLDTTRSRQVFQQIINRLEAGQIDILVGTQMVSKGFDFENVTLVGVINADNLLTFPDFRAHERAFQLLMQVSGRSGRSRKQGRVLIQSFMPESPVLRAVEFQQPFRDFFMREAGARQELGYPPFRRMARIELSHRDREFLEQESLRLDAQLRPRFGADLLGPDYPLIPRLRNRYRMQFLLKFDRSEPPGLLRSRIREALEHYYREAPAKTLQVMVDVDPV